jgi:hypothetical protein
MLLQEYFGEYMVSKSIAIENITYSGVMRLLFKIYFPRPQNILKRHGLG